MSRGLSSGMSTAASSQGTIPAVIFVEMDLDSGTLRFSNLGETVQWNGQSWLGGGKVGTIDPIEETDSEEATGIAFVLSGCDGSLVATALTENIQGRHVKMWFAFLDPTTYQPVNSPLLVRDDLLDVMTGTVGPQCTIRVTAEPREADFRRPREYRWNDATLQAAHPGALGFQYQLDLLDKPLIWGRAS